jgi:hypothetical protein
MTNLATAIQAAHIANEQKIAATVERVSPELSADELAALSVFNRWCGLNGLRNIPANPRVVAAWIRSEKGTDPNKIIETLSAIERLHDFHSLPNPIATSTVRNELGRVMNIQPPRSWRKSEQLVFMSLPVEIRAAIERREHQRETELRRLQNEVAELKKRQAQSATTTEETENATQEK